MVLLLLDIKGLLADLSTLSLIVILSGLGEVLLAIVYVSSVSDIVCDLVVLVMCLVAVLLGVLFGGPAIVCVLGTYLLMVLQALLRVNEFLAMERVSMALVTYFVVGRVFRPVAVGPGALSFEQFSVLEWEAF